MHNIDIDQIKSIAVRAGKIVLDFYQKDYTITDKSDNSPVTEADLASDKFIKGELAPFGWPILSEESRDNSARTQSDYVWLVDPLDGTNDFIQKTGEFCILIGLVYKQIPILGVVYEPVAENIYYAQNNQGAFLEKGEIKQKLSVSNKKGLSECAILFSRNHLLEKEQLFFEKANLKNKINMGSAGLKLCSIASGYGEIYINSSDKTSEWDTGAAGIILKEAGGKITDLDGHDLFYNKSNPKHLRGYISTNGIIHQSCLSIIKNI